MRKSGVKVLVLDNYDSFTWNLVHGLESAGATCTVHRSDAIALSQIEDLRPDAMVLSPGPFGPDQTGICRDALAAWHGRIPILGVCLGMQVVSVVHGATVVPSGEPAHGRASPIHHDGKGIFHDLPQGFQAARYHSLIVDPATIPTNLEVSAQLTDGTIMGVRHGLTEGVLFHPESFLTEHSTRIFRNFISA